MVILQPEYAVNGENDAIVGRATTVKEEMVRGGEYEASLRVTDDSPREAAVPMMSVILVLLIKTQVAAAFKEDVPELMSFTEAVHDELASKLDPDIVMWLPT